MSNLYPKVFYNNCVGKVPCDINSSCSNTKMEQDMKKNNKIHQLRERFNPLNNSKANLKNKCSNKNNYQCKGYKSPSKIIKSNEVEFPINNPHSWSNTRSYGNIIIATNDTCSNIHGKVKPYNRT
jgi:hypothetical protein